ncbi:MAG TPA: molybdate ABC transporter substrate-binding protein [Bryobacteraceae bacterium]|nr:molybdate ABC transporter substrate-binding protein [Bryobacteraceae bacterium]
MAAASNLSEVFTEIAEKFLRESGIRVVYSFASTAQLAQQIENAAPFDVFASADTEHVDALIRKGQLTPESRAVFARGRLALWLPGATALGLESLASPAIRFISIANPAVAPYGRAAVETLKAAGLWDRVQDKIVYASNISMARQHAASGNADAAFTALSLVLKDKGTVLRVEENLHSPVDQALGILTSSKRKANANSFRNFLIGSSGRTILARYGYSFPSVK